ncbi:hypothetical protein [Candidatus Reidiella endopervernicosa]|uniref:Uncharacterized protein n=1 Tax=Candidatus Reidiella endopervernicosa TaxID=2738883 RepID=A0A6N0HWR1_9GAMM|nr:hypothetical protein [Candidatus Reidiella endopervernicosa]QKQ26818.1 hypothetical protein HUE57_11395 [Candidatus Reidiella endopervernicosa]
MNQLVAPYMSALKRYWPTRNNKKLSLRQSQKNVDCQFEKFVEAQGERPLLVIKERDVGLFSLFLQVINTLLCKEEQSLQCDVVVDFSGHQAYFTGTNTWDECFESLNGLDSSVEVSLRRVQKHYGRRVKQMRFWDLFGSIYRVDSGLFWSASYYPLFNSTSAEHHISHKQIPTDSDRQRANKVIGRYIKVNRGLLEKRDAFVADHFKGKRVIGVQFRGTDARHDSRRTIPSYERFHRVIRDEISNIDSDTDVVIFVASDEQAFVDDIRGQFHNVVSAEVLRDEGGVVEGRGPRKWLMPNFIERDRKGALEGVMLDYLLLCRSQVLIHNFGGLTNAVLLTEPEIKSVLISEGYLEPFTKN